jgi:hypothetical protein
MPAGVGGPSLGFVAPATPRVFPKRGPGRIEGPERAAEREERWRARPNPKEMPQASVTSGAARVAAPS